jgi:hypothetical protein
MLGLPMSGLTALFEGARIEATPRPDSGGPSEGARFGERWEQLLDGCPDERGTGRETSF